MATKETLKEYTVVSGAITYRNGRDVLRFHRGDRLQLFPSDERTRYFLRHAAIVEHDAEKKLPRPTPRIVVRAFGAAEDPIARPEGNPLPATAEQISENL